jgi:hypothetical protein
LPGEYRAVLEVNDNKFDRNVLIKDDPERGISLDERKLNQKYVREASALSASASRLLMTSSNVSTQLEQLEARLKSMKDVDKAVLDKAKAVKDKLAEIQQLFSRSPEGQTRYRQPVKVALRGGTTAEQILRIAGEISGYPGAPTQTTINRVEEFKAFLEPLTAKMAEITGKDIPELNKFLAEKGVPYIKI